MGKKSFSDGRCQSATARLSRCVVRQRSETVPDGFYRPDSKLIPESLSSGDSKSISH